MGSPNVNSMLLSQFHEDYQEFYALTHMQKLSSLCPTTFTQSLLQDSSKFYECIAEALALGLTDHAQGQDRGPDRLTEEEGGQEATLQILGIDEEDPGLGIDIEGMILERIEKGSESGRERTWWLERSIGWRSPGEMKRGRGGRSRNEGTQRDLGRCPALIRLQ